METGEPTFRGFSWKKLLLIAIVLHFLLMLSTGLFNYWGLLISINDMGSFQQAVWGAMHKGYLHSSIVFNQDTHRFAEHFDPILYVFVPLYFLYPTVTWLIAAQALALAFTAWPLYLIAKTVLGNDKHATLLSLAYLSNPFILNAGAWAFQPIVLAAPFIALAFMATERRSFRSVLMSVLVILACKGHLGLLVVGFGILWWYSHRECRRAAILTTIGLVHAYIVLVLIQPYYSPTDQPALIGRYAWMGETATEILLTAFSRPHYVIGEVFAQGGGLYLFLLLFPFLFIPVLSPVFLAPGLADLAANLLSANPMPRGIAAYHSATLIPIVFVALVHGLKRIESSCLVTYVKPLVLSVFCVNFALGYLFAPYPLPGALNIWNPVSFVQSPDPRVDEILREVGPTSSLSVQNNVGPHFAQRRHIYAFPHRLDDVDYVVLHLESPTKRVRNGLNVHARDRRNIIGTLDSHLKMDRFDYLALVEQLLADDRFGVVYWNAPWVVFKAGSAIPNATESVVDTLDSLRREWSADDIGHLLNRGTSSNIAFPRKPRARAL